MGFWHRTLRKDGHFASITTYLHISQKKKVLLHCQELRQEFGDAGWLKNIEFSQGMSLGSDFPVTAKSHPDFAALIENYYDNDIENEHMRKGGDNAEFGFGHCGLPLILDHNTPNNSIASSVGRDRGGQMGNTR